MTKLRRTSLCGLIDVFCFEQHFVTLSDAWDFSLPHHFPDGMLTTTPDASYVRGSQVFRIWMHPFGYLSQLVFDSSKAFSQFVWHLKLNGGHAVYLLLFIL
jgi:hypothetical protein